MTFCVGWKILECVFLFGDTLLTNYDSEKLPTVPKTSFGELQGKQEVYGKNAIVEEGGVKIRTFEKSAIAFAGSLKTALALEDMVQECLELGATAKDSLQSALYSIQPVSANEEATILLACHEDGKAKLFRLDTLHNGSIEEIDELVQIGSISKCHRENVENMIASLTKELLTRYRPDHHSYQNILIRIAALLQSLGIHDFIVSEGVGGAFVGVCISECGVIWQPDTLYCLHPPIPEAENIFFTGLFVRDQVVCLVSTAANVNIYMASPLKYESYEARMARVLAVSDVVLNQFDSGRFEYLIFLNTALHTSTVLEMNGECCHGLAVVDAENPIKGRIGILWSPGLLKLVNTIPCDADGGQPDLCVRWLPYWPPDDETLAEIRNILVSVHAAETDDRQETENTRVKETGAGLHLVKETGKQGQVSTYDISQVET